MVFALIVAALYAASPAANPAQAPAAEKAASQPGATPQPNTKAETAQTTIICRTEAVTGSIFPKKICATKAELESRQERDQGQLDRMRTPTPMRPPGS